MKQVSVSELKSRLSYFLRLVAAGETIEVLDRRMPVARLDRVGPDAGNDADLMRRLLRDGLVTPPRRAGRHVFDSPPVPCPVDIVSVIREDRDAR
jgi:antitoxin (DNA-binding transcriptional repressor) of toxin-antitoxin stability system